MSVAEHAENLQAVPLTGAGEAETMFDLEALRAAVVKEDPYRYLVVPDFVRPDALAALFSAAGLEQVEAEAITIDTHFDDFDDYWSPFLGGQGPAPAYATALDDAARTRLRERLRAQVPTAADGSITLSARAWAVKAVSP